MATHYGARELSALGHDAKQVPKQMSTGDRTILGRISKRGNRYLRTLLMQGARVILLRPANWARQSSPKKSPVCR
jgi:transposase